MDFAGWADDAWNTLTSASSGTYAAWAGVLLGFAALLYAHRQIKRAHRANAEHAQPSVAMFMEPSAGDWHLIELVVKNFGKTPAYDISFDFEIPPNVPQYEHSHGLDGLTVTDVALPEEIPMLAPNQEWRTVWDSAMNREHLGTLIESRFDGTLIYFAAPASAGGSLFNRAPKPLQTKVVLDWGMLQPVDRLELMTGHDRARREKQKLELLRSMLTYFHYAAKETSPEVFRSEIDRMNRAADETQKRWHKQQLNKPEPNDHHDPPTDVTLRIERIPSDDIEPGKHRRRRSA